MPRPGTTTARGYGSEHQRLRADLAEHQRLHGGLTCWRCGRWIPLGHPFDLGHDDHDRRIYRGAECVPCNRAAGARKGNRSRHRRQHPVIVADLTDL